MTDFVTLLGLVSILIWLAMFILAPIVGVLIFLFRRKKMIAEFYPGKDDIMDLVAHEDQKEDEPESAEELDAIVEELPFCQLFTLGPNMCLMVDHVEMCPDETAFIRVVDEDAYTPLYKRRVRRDKHGNRMIAFNGANYYLNDKRTQPIITKK